MSAAFGFEKGDVCWRNGCQGIIAEHPVQNCSCHIAPPCGQCTESREYCETCGWEQREDGETKVVPWLIIGPDAWVGSVEPKKERPLDPRKIDYLITSHTNSSQLCTGVYPEGTTMAEVRDMVNGSFGGRFNYFTGGKFQFVAYTD